MIALKPKATRLCYRDEDLRGADFSNADIRGVDFSGANLSDADFSGARAGLPLWWSLIVMTIVLLLALLAGYIIGYIGVILIFPIEGACNQLQPDKFSTFLATAIPLLIFAIFSLVLTWKGLGSALGVAGLAVVTGIVLLNAMAPDIDGSNACENSELYLQGILTFRPLILLGIGGGLMIGSIPVSVTVNQAKIWPVSLVFAAGLLGISSGAQEAIGKNIDQITVYTITFFLLCIATVVLTSYVGCQASRGNTKYMLIARASIFLSTIGGTSFHGTNLTNANFSKADLKSTNFRNSLLTRSNWFQAKNLKAARIDGTYLANSAIRNLLVNKIGIGETFENNDLHDLNLEGANLSQVNFINTRLNGSNLQRCNLAGANLSKADLSGANLREADLSGTILIQAQLYRADLSGSMLTGACVQNWAISTDTNLDKIQCDYIYLTDSSSGDSKDRKPDSGIFASGELKEFLSPIVKSYAGSIRHDLAVSRCIDLFHRNQFQSEAVCMALRQLAEEFPAAGLGVRAIEGQGDGRVRIQLKISEKADRSIVSKRYKDLLNDFSANDLSLYTQLQAIAQKEEALRKYDELMSKDAARANILSLHDKLKTAFQNKYYVELAYSLFSSKVFLSYRRSDSSDLVGRIYDRLVESFGPQSVFKDIDSIPLGVDFPTCIKLILSECSFFMAIIGPNWIHATDVAGNSRLADSKDFVRLEIETALALDIPLMPVLLSNAQMPSSDQLPDSLKAFAFRNGMSIRFDRDFYPDMNRVIEKLSDYIPPLHS
jgi:uncharacterized protein YjbI with pentapeptide repeats